MYMSQRLVRICTRFQCDYLYTMYSILITFWNFKNEIVFSRWNTRQSSLTNWWNRNGAGMCTLRVVSCDSIGLCCHAMLPSSRQVLCGALFDFLFTSKVRKLQTFQWPRICWDTLGSISSYHPLRRYKPNLQPHLLFRQNVSQKGTSAMRCAPTERSSWNGMYHYCFVEPQQDSARVQDVSDKDGYHSKSWSSRWTKRCGLRWTKGLMGGSI